MATTILKSDGFSWLKRGKNMGGHGWEVQCELGDEIFLVLVLRPRPRSVKNFEDEEEDEEEGC